MLCRFAVSRVAAKGVVRQALASSSGMFTGESSSFAYASHASLSQPRWNSTTPGIDAIKNQVVSEMKIVSRKQESVESDGSKSASETTPKVDPDTTDTNPDGSESVSETTTDAAPDTTDTNPDGSKIGS
jgi:hypothetical protein